MKLFRLLSSLAIATSLLVAGGAGPSLATEQADVDMEVIPAFESDYPTAVALLSPSSSGAVDADSADDPSSGVTVTTPVEPVAVQPAELAGSWYCSVYADDPRHTIDQQGYEVIQGYGFQSCSGVGWQLQRFKIQVQQYRGFGHWATKSSWVSEYTNNSFVSRTQWWRCASGTGKQTYRIVTTGWAETGRYGISVQSENYLRVTCP